MQANARIRRWTLLSGNGSVPKVVIDFDDLATGNDRLDILLKLKERDPGFKVTLFAIPARCDDVLLKRYDTEKGWIQLGVHGFRHSRHEALGWMQDEAEDKLERAMRIYPFAPIFKAPNWTMTDEVYAACIRKGFGIADHLENTGIDRDTGDSIIPIGTPVYIYNLHLRHDSYIRLHGHIQNWNHTGLEDNYEQWSGPEVGSDYLFVTEALAPWQGMGV